MPLFPHTRMYYETVKFCDIWKDYDAFKDDYDALYALLAGGTSTMQPASIVATYYLLYSKYGNTPIAGTDQEQWKMKMFSIMCSYGPLWERKKGVLKSIRELTETELLLGAKQIYNHAFNPSTTPATGDLDELTYINEQNTTSNKKAKLEAYSLLWSALHADPTKSYLDEFKVCFSRFVGNQFPIIYVTEEEEEE